MFNATVGGKERKREGEEGRGERKERREGSGYAVTTVVAEE